MFQGSIVALITPFDLKGNVDVDALEKLIEYQIESQTNGLVLCGSTGEGSSLDLEEKLLIFQKAVEVARGRITLIAGTGSNQTKESVALTKKAKEIGVDGCIAIVPYYTRPTEEGCFRHFSAVAGVGLPLIIYHHPGRTGLRLSLDALVQLSHIQGVVGLKEASGDLNLAQDLIQLVKCPLLSGDDSLALAHFAVGFAGSISVIGNVVPAKWKEFVEKSLSGDMIAARKAYKQLHSLVKALSLEINPQCIKYAVSLLGLCHSTMRLPLIEPSEKVRARLLNELCNKPRPASLMGST